MIFLSIKKVLPEYFQFHFNLYGYCRIIIITSATLIMDLLLLVLLTPPLLWITAILIYYGKFDVMCTNFIKTPLTFSNTSGHLVFMSFWAAQSTLVSTSELQCSWIIVVLLLFIPPLPQLLRKKLISTKNNPLKPQ